MARLLKLCMACALLLSIVPTMTAIASRPHHAHAACCPDRTACDSLCADHGCSACPAVADVALETIAPSAPSVAPITVDAAPLADHHARFDPPPPRPAG